MHGAAALQPRGDWRCGRSADSGGDQHQRNFVYHSARRGASAREFRRRQLCGRGAMACVGSTERARGRIHPTQVYAIDPGTPITGTQSASGVSTWSYVRPALTVEPYAIAYNCLFDWRRDSMELGPGKQQLFLRRRGFSNASVLVGWSTGHSGDGDCADLELFSAGRRARDARLASRRLRQRVDGNARRSRQPGRE